MQVVLSPRAKLDLQEIMDFIAADNPARAITFGDEILAHSQKLGQAPEGYPARDDIFPGLRMATHGRYLLLFRVLDTALRIERIVHGARDQAEVFA